MNSITDIYTSHGTISEQSARDLAQKIAFAKKLVLKGRTPLGFCLTSEFATALDRFAETGYKEFKKPTNKGTMRYSLHLLVDGKKEVFERQSMNQKTGMKKAVKFINKLKAQGKTVEIIAD